MRSPLARARSKQRLDVKRKAAAACMRARARATVFVTRQYPSTHESSTALATAALSMNHNARRESNERHRRRRRRRRRRHRHRSSARASSRSHTLRAHARRRLHTQSHSKYAANWRPAPLTHANTMLLVVVGVVVGGGGGGDGGGGNGIRALDEKSWRATQGGAFAQAAAAAASVTMRFITNQFAASERARAHVCAWTCAMNECKRVRACFTAFSDGRDDAPIIKCFCKRKLRAEHVFFCSVFCLFKAFTLLNSPLRRQTRAK